MGNSLFYGTGGYDQCRRCRVVRGQNDLYILQLEESEDPGIDDIFHTGTIAHILQVLKLPDGTARILVEGKQRAIVRKIKQERNYSFVQVTPIKINTETDPALIPIMAAVLKSFIKYCGLKKTVAKDAV